ncbi:copper chaperone PCu(A)C, partial [Jatrophihabitans sp.]|uniref:copper chaperone PCu(A)C n=1 Tax=Jatrophihabitans sp. TaxID=1932789 RepID=UPI002F1126B2
TTATPDVLTTVASGAGEQTTLHTESSGGMQQSTGLSIPARGSVTLSPGKGHVMIEKLYGPLKPGQNVNFQLTFAKAGELLLTAPVIAVAAPAPTAEGP